MFANRSDTTAQLQPLQKFVKDTEVIMVRHDAPATSQPKTSVSQQLPDAFEQESSLPDQAANKKSKLEEQRRVQHTQQSGSVLRTRSALQPEDEVRECLGCALFTALCTSLGSLLCVCFGISLSRTKEEKVNSSGLPHQQISVQPVCSECCAAYTPAPNNTAPTGTVDDKISAPRSVFNNSITITGPGAIDLHIHFARSPGFDEGRFQVSGHLPFYLVNGGTINVVDAAIVNVHYHAECTTESEHMTQNWGAANPICFMDTVDSFTINKSCAVNLHLHGFQISAYYIISRPETLADKTIKFLREATIKITKAGRYMTYKHGEIQII